MTRIYLIRHAQAEGNLYHRMNGWYNGLVTELGRRQIAALQCRFDSIHVDSVYSSPLFRCTTTARAVFVPKQLPLNLEGGLMEIGVGAWENVPFGDVQLHDPVQLGLFLETSPAFKVQDGETFPQLQQRVVGAIQRIADANPNKTVACFTHGMAIRSALSYFHGYGNAYSKVPHSENTGVSCLEIDGRNVKVVFEADASHLPRELYSGGVNHGKVSALVDSSRNLWFRPWKPYEEKDLYISFRHEAWVDIHGREAFFDGEAFYRVAERSSIQDPRSVMVAYLNHDIVGMIQTDLDRDVGEGVCFVPFVYMNPETRHHGLGVQLLGQAIAVARPLGRDKLRLRCAPTNGVAKRFYARYGFHKVGMAKDSRVPLELLEKYIGYQPDTQWGERAERERKSK